MTFQEWMTTSLGFRCPKCKHEFEHKGGLMSQMRLATILSAMKKNGANLTCHFCGHKWYQPPAPPEPTLWDKVKRKFTG